MVTKAGDHLQLPPTIKSLGSNGGKEKRKGVQDLKSERSTVAEPKKEEEPTPTPNEPPAATAADTTISPSLPSATADTTDSTTSLSLSADPSSAEPPSTAAPPPPPPTITHTPILPLALSPTLETTLFERLLPLHGPQIRRMLSISYRFNSKICSFPSKALYDGELRSDQSVEGRTLSGLLEELGVREREEGGEEEGVESEEVVFIDSEFSFSLSRVGREADQEDMGIAAGLAMYERAGDSSSTGDSGGKGAGGFGAESKSNENEASLCVGYVESLVRLPPPSFSSRCANPLHALVPRARADRLRTPTKVHHPPLTL